MRAENALDSISANIMVDVHVEALDDFAFRIRIKAVYFKIDHRPVVCPDIVKSVWIIFIGIHGDLPIRLACFVAYIGIMIDEHELFGKPREVCFIII